SASVFDPVQNMDFAYSLLGGGGGIWVKFYKK
ncbi:MAG: hypothetical protein ACI81G_000295, partial [Gammaproteobacteria bacterium]